MAMTPEELLALYEDPERRRKAENATRDRTLLASLSEAYAQSQEPYGAKYHELAGQNAMLAAQQPVKAFEREQEGLSGALNANRAKEQLQMQEAANEAARADRLAGREQEQSQFERLLSEREAERARKAESDAAHLDYLYENMKRKAAKGNGAGASSGTMTKKGDLGIEIDVPTREEFYGTDQEYNNLTKLAKSKNAADRDRAFKLLDQDADRRAKFSADPNKLAEVEGADRIVKGLLAQTTGEKDAPPGLGGSFAERLTQTNTGYGVLDRPAQIAGSIFLNPEQQANASDFQKVVNTHIKRMAGSGVSANEADRVMKSFGANVPWTDPVVRRKLLEAMDKDNETLRSLLTGNPYTRGKKTPVKAQTFPVVVRAKNDGSFHTIKDQKTLDEALSDATDPVEIVGQ